MSRNVAKSGSLSWVHTVGGVRRYVLAAVAGIALAVVVWFIAPQQAAPGTSLRAEFDAHLTVRTYDLSNTEDRWDLLWLVLGLTDGHAAANNETP